MFPIERFLSELNVDTVYCNLKIFFSYQNFQSVKVKFVLKKELLSLQLLNMSQELLSKLQGTPLKVGHFLLLYFSIAHSFQECF